jgi:predicted transcriptional regulator
MTNAYVQTYDNLVQDVINYMERNDAQFVAQIPSLIGLAESAIAAELKTYIQLTVVETTLAQGQSILAKPARWRKTITTTQSRLCGAVSI